MAEKPTYHELEQRVKELEEDSIKLKLTEEELHDKDKHIQSILESAKKFALYRLTSNKTDPHRLKVKFVSPSIKDILGVPEPMKFETWFESMHPDDVERVTEANQRAFKTLRFDEEFRIFNQKKDEWRWIHAISTGVVDKKGEAESVDGILLDITDRRQAEEINKTLIAISNAVSTTQNLKDLYRFIHNSLGSIMDVANFYIAMVDINKRTLYFPYHVDTTDDDFSPITDFDINNSLTGLVVSQRKPILLKKSELEKLSAQKSVWGPVPMIWMGAPLIVKDEIIGVVGVQSYLDSNLYNEQDLQVLSGISDQVAIAVDRKQAQDALLKSETRYARAVRGTNDGLWDWNVLTNEDYLSPRWKELLGYADDELTNHYDTFFSRVHPDDTSRVQDAIQAHFEQDVPYNIEHRLRTKSGEYRWFSVRGKADRDEQGKAVLMSGAITDITERKRAEEEKIKAQKIAEEQKKLALVGQVAGKMAHDFNNILGIIMGNTELTLLDCQEPETRKTLELIFEQTIRGKNLTKNLVVFAKDQEPKQEFFSISEKIDLVIKLIKKDLEGIEVLKEESQGVSELLADPGMIEHALVNLIQNSIHALSMVEHPRITFRTYSSDKHICFEIEDEDNGCGISKENLEDIYEPSFTLKGSRDVTGSYKSDIKGTGYGMANVKKYVEQHKGSISIESEVGVGATFTICLPITKKELTTKEKAELKKEITQFEKYILLVEDETAISDIQYRILTSEPCNHKVDVAHNGQMAKDLFERNTYDFVSLDYVLPGGINGMDVYHHIRKTNKTVPVLFISGNIDFLESIKELKQKDAYIDHLSKPCQNKDYVNGINELLEKTLTL